MKEGAREGVRHKGMCQGGVKDGVRVGIRKCKGGCKVMDGGMVVMIDGWSWLAGWT